MWQPLHPPPSPGLSPPHPNVMGNLAPPPYPIDLFKLVYLGTPGSRSPLELFKMVTSGHPCALSPPAGKRAIGLWLKCLLVWSDYSLKIKNGDLVIELVPYSCKTHCHYAFHRKIILTKVVTERHEANVNNFQLPIPLLPTKPESINNGEPCVSGHKNESLNIWVTSRWGAAHSPWVSGSGIDIGWAELPHPLWF